MDNNTNNSIAMTAFWFRIIHFERKGMLLRAGLTTVPATRTFLNIGDVTKLIPLTGITLPFNPPLTVSTTDAPI